MRPLNRFLQVLSDSELDQLHERMIRETNFDKLKGMCRQFEKHIIEEKGYSFPLLWWNRTVPHNARMKGWKISPSHYLNQDLSNVWLASE